MPGASFQGTPMRGVTAYPFDKQMSVYVSDFSPVVAQRLSHPYQSLTERNADSIDFNIFTGSAYHPPVTAHTEYRRSFQGMGARRGFDRPLSPGLRSEQLITVGQYVPVLRADLPR
jgi:hypothetical protein